MEVNGMATQNGFSSNNERRNEYIIHFAHAQNDLNLLILRIFDLFLLDTAHLRTCSVVKNISPFLQRSVSENNDI